MTPCALSTASLSSPHTVDESESAFSFSLPDMRGLFDEGVEISSTETVGEVVLTVSTPEMTGVTEVTGVADGPFPVTRTPFFPILDKGSYFLVLIWANMALVNFVVMSARRKHL